MKQTNLYDEIEKVKTTAMMPKLYSRQNEIKRLVKGRVEVIVAGKDVHLRSFMANFTCIKSEEWSSYLLDYRSPSEITCKECKQRYVESQL